MRGCLRHFFKFLCLILSFLATLPCALISSPFEIQIDGFSYRTDHFWNKHGTLRPAHSYLDFTGAAIWIVARPLTRLQLSLTTAWQNGKECLNGTSRGLSDIELTGSSLMTQFKGGDLFLQGTLIVPSGRSKEMIRYGEWGGEAGLFYQRPFALHCSSPTHYFFGSLGFRGYGGAASNLVRATLGALLNPIPYLHIRAAFQLDYGLFDGHRANHPNAFLYNPNFRLLNFEGIVSYPIWKGFCINGGGFCHIWGENIGNNGGFFGGVSYVF